MSGYKSLLCAPPIEQVALDNSKINPSSPIISNPKQKAKRLASTTLVCKYKITFIGSRPTEPCHDAVKGFQIQ